ncbi:RNA exonuclease 4 [Capsicum baccatum]|uniref:RNA exonuclease 4 n=1 Tax=Capsicum baccatum TaxID=33114 RepID=A0A2G2X2N5_CAPBA|nr:RNA exonuclease 4 [Capsicum baccatum]
MGSELKKPKKQFQLNPNWAQLRQQLKSNGFQKQLSNPSQTENPNSILGKRKSRSSDDDSGDARPNPLIPTSSDSSVTDVIAIDCEMVGVSYVGNRSALGRVTLVNQWGNVIYDEYVRPAERVVDFRTKISGIRPQHLKKAKDFHVVQEEVAALIKGRILVGHALRNDFKALLLGHQKQDIRDTSEYKHFLSREGRKPALRNLATEVLGVGIQNGEHCPIEDARAAMMLYLKHRKEWEKSIKDFARLKEKQKKRKPKKKNRRLRTVNNAENAS